jgi:hypothetical protein
MDLGHAKRAVETQLLADFAKKNIGGKIAVRRAHQYPLYDKFIVYRHDDGPGSYRNSRSEKMRP